MLETTTLDRYLDQQLIRKKEEFESIIRNEDLMSVETWEKLMTAKAKVAIASNLQSMNMKINHGRTKAILDQM